MKHHNFIKQSTHVPLMHDSSQQTTNITIQVDVGPTLTRHLRRRFKIGSTLTREVVLAGLVSAQLSYIFL